MYNNMFNASKEAERISKVSSNLTNVYDDEYDYTNEAATAAKNVYVKGISPKTLAIIAGLGGIYYAGTQNVHRNIIGFKGDGNITY